jgi:hypothetical protein
MVLDFRIVSASFNQRPARHVAVGFGDLAQFAGQVEFFVLQLELANPSPDIGLDVGDPGDRLQIASHGSGAATSHHAGQLQHDLLDGDAVVGGREDWLR